MPQPTSCQHARTWLSLRLDAELSEMERKLLAAHLDGCPDCAAGAVAVETVTLTIRTAAPERPPALAAPRMRARGSMRAFYAAAGASLAAVVLAGSVGFVGAFHLVAQTSATPKIHRVSAVADGMSDDLALLTATHVLRVERPAPGHIVWPV